MKLAPACKRIVSPQLVASKTAWRSPPAGTYLETPGAGVFAVEVFKKTRGNSAGPSKLPLAEDTVSVRVCEADRLAASVTLVTKVKLPIWAVVPLSRPLELSSRTPPGSVPEATLQT